jgi:hypothetical protein
LRSQKKIKTFYWHDRVRSPIELFIRKLINKDVSRYFRVGNSGDIITNEIIRFIYGHDAINTKDQEKRLLCVGSISHKILPGDVICGIGTKGLRIPPASKVPCTILGLRGPITYDAFKKAGHDVSRIEFLMDPGLMIRFMTKNINTVEPHKNRVIFIPHYRERNIFGKLPKGIDLIDIDMHPTKLAIEILKSCLICSSSLHGIIFAHALNRPAIFIRPQTDEPIIKFKDYFASIGRELPMPLSDIYAVKFIKSPDSPLDLNYKLEDFKFPSINMLETLGILE